MENRKHIIEKIEKVKNYIEEKRVDGIILTKKSNFSWITGGKRNRVVDESEIGNSSILITRNGCYLVTDNIEEPRIHAEEIGDKIFKRAVIFNWFEQQNKYKNIIKIVGSKNILSDIIYEDFDILDDDFEKLKYILNNKEKETLKELGIKTSHIVFRVCMDTKRGNSEFNSLALLRKYLTDEGITPYVSFIGSDERIFNYRHPITTFKKIDNYFIVVICSEFKGLIISMSRSVYFGKVPKELEEKKNILAQMDAEIINYTRPGKTYAKVFKFIRNTYKKYGYKDEWIHHLQGGPIGYSPRYFLANEFTEVPVEVGHAFAWNPTIRGTKSEDTFLVEEDLNECLTYNKNWPSIEVKINGKIIRRPDILVREK